MEKDSLEKAKKIIIDSLLLADISELDKLELILNLKCLLKYENYDEAIRTLSKGNSKWKK